MTMNFFIEGIIGAIILGIIQIIIGIIIPIITIPVTLVISKVENKFRKDYLPIYNTFRFDHFVNFTLINLISILLTYYLLSLFPWGLKLNILAIIITIFRHIIIYDSKNGFWYEFSIILGRVIGLIFGFLLISEIYVPTVLNNKTEITNEFLTEVNETIFRIQENIKLTENQNGVNGELQLLIDNSISENVNDITEIPSTLEKYPQNAIIQIVTNSNEIIYQEILERCLAWLDKKYKIKNDPHWIALTVDYSMGMGSYNGDITSFIKIENSKVKRMTAVENNTNNIDTVYLMKSLKTDWQISQIDGTSIFKKACRPNFDSNNGDFLIIYTRYYFDQNQWKKEEYTEIGFWESTNAEQFSIENEFLLKFRDK